MVGIALLPFSAKVRGEWIRGVILWRSGSVRSYKSRNNVIFQLLFYYMTHPWHSPYTCLQTKKKASPYLQAKLELDRMHIFYWTVMKQWKIWHQTNTTWHWNKMTIWYKNGHTSIPLSNSHCMQAVLPPSTAQWRQQEPPLSLLSINAPFSNSITATLMWPPAQANIILKYF